MTASEAFERTFVAVSLLLGGRGAADLSEPSEEAGRVDAHLRSGSTSERGRRLGVVLVPLAERLDARRQR